MPEDELSSLNKEKLSLSEDGLLDPAKRAEEVLEQILGTEEAIRDTGPVAARMTVADAIAARPVLDQDTGRTKPRVLIVTTNESVLLAGTSIREEFVGLSRQLDELHIICLIARQGKEGFDRAGDNLWFYQVRGKHWWSLPKAAKRAAIEALTWNGVPRPDIVVGIDPFEAGLAARSIARKFGRPVQYHVYTDFFHPDYKGAAPDNNWRIRIAKFLLRRAKSVRTPTTLLKEALAKKFRRINDLTVLPRFYNFTGLLDSKPAFDLHQKFKDFVFIILAFGPLTATSPLHDLFAALNRLLRNPRIGLLVIGDGPARAIFQEKVKILGIEKSVVFQKEIEDQVSHLKTADLMVELNTDEESETRVLQAAAAGLPLVMRATDLRRDLFKDGTSAFLCEVDDILCISEKTSKFINTPVLREQFADFAQDIARERLHEDPEAHFQALTLSIEAALIPTQK